jgi:hypothetical protein
MSLKKFFGKKPGKEEIPEEEKCGIFIRVMQGDYQKIAIERFDISVADAMDMVLNKLNLPKKLDNGLSIKYFFFRKSNLTNDGIELLAEVTEDGGFTTLSGYGLRDNSQLELGAITVKNAEEAVDEEGLEFNDNREDYAPDDDDEIAEV